MIIFPQKADLSIQMFLKPEYFYKKLFLCGVKQQHGFSTTILNSGAEMHLRDFRKTLFGEGGVQDLDGQAHRKEMFMSLMSDSSIDKLVGLIEEEFDRQLDLW